MSKIIEQRITNNMYQSNDIYRNVQERPNVDLVTEIQRLERINRNYIVDVRNYTRKQILDKYYKDKNVTDLLYLNNYKSEIEKIILSKK